MEFFRHCPQCGRRFHIKLVNKKLVGRDEGSLPRREVVSTQYAYSPSHWGAPLTGPPVVVHEGAPIIIEVETFQYYYKCQHCGHEWFEKHIEEQKQE